MLTLGRKQDESIVIDLRKFGAGLIEVMVVQGHPHTKLGIEAMRGIPVHRKEVFLAEERKGKEAAK